jgi:ATP/maltotriose-dependent transcriptional regulator MalT
VGAIAAYGAFVRGDLDRAIALAEHAVTLTERDGTTSSGLAERTLGNACFYQGDTERALEWMDRMLESARTTGSAARLTHGLYMRSVAATSVGDARLGAQLADEAGTAAERSGSATAIAQARYAAGLAAESTAPDDALALLSESAEVARAVRNRWVEAFALTEVLWLEAQRGRPIEALAGFASVVDTWYRGGDWANQWLSLRHVCGIFAQVGEHRSAAVLYGAIAAAGAAIALPFEPSDAERLGGLVEELRAILGAAEFAAAVREGAASRDAALVQFVQDEIRRLTTAPGRAFAGR